MSHHKLADSAFFARALAGPTAGFEDLPRRVAIQMRLSPRSIAAVSRDASPSSQIVMTRTKQASAADAGAERWAACKTCRAFILMPARGTPPPVFRARCDGCKSQGVYLRTDIFERPRRTH